MEERTRAYLRGRFRDYYRHATITPPPDPRHREWGYIPFSPSGTTMVRHQSTLELGDIETFLQRERPRHVYFSAGYYDDPGAEQMDAKGWRGSDLVFDLDADHLPAVDPNTTTLADMLGACKDALIRLLDFLETDFGFEDITITFSGGRGYHVHVRDASIQQLDRDSRREIVEYVRGIEVDFDHVVATQSVAGPAGRQSPAEKRLLTGEGGWSRRVHDRLLALVEDLLAADREQAIETLTTYDGIATGKAEAILTALENNQAAIRRGNIDLHPAFVSLVRGLVAETRDAERAPIDEPVTTDTHRLIRLPGSLHGGSGLRVTRIGRDALDAFDPLSDAVPETFRGAEIAIDVTDLSGLPPMDDPTVGQVELGGGTFTVTDGNDLYPEFLGIFLMTRGRAEKDRE